MIKLALTDDEVDALLISMNLFMDGVGNVLDNNDNIPDELLGVTKALASIADKIHVGMPKEKTKSTRFDC